MKIDLSFLPALGATFLLVFARTGTMLMLLPGLGEQNISARMRLTFALMLAAMLLPLHRDAFHIDPTALGPMGISEPLKDAPLVDPDLLFTPLACYDRQGRRIGYGAGFYDRTLARLRAMKTIRAVGVAYGVCEVAVVPYEAHDQTLDAIVTEQETIFVSER